MASMRNCENLTDHLYKMSRAVSSYRISGVAPIRKVVDETLGNLAVRCAADSPLAPDGGRGFNVRFWKILAQLATVLAVFNGSYVALGHVDARGLESGHMIAGLPPVIAALPPGRSNPGTQPASGEGGG